MSLSIGLTCVPAKLVETEPENGLYICHTFYISYNKSVGSK